MFFEVRKKPEGNGGIVTLDSDSATQKPTELLLLQLL